MTLTDAGTELDLTVLEALDHDVQCDAPGCEAAAVWSLRNPCCGVTWVTCHPCRVETDLGAELHVAFGGRWKCAACSEPLLIPLLWLPL